MLRSARFLASSNCLSSQSETPTRPAATALAQSTYSLRRWSGERDGGLKRNRAQVRHLVGQLQQFRIARFLGSRLYLKLLPHRLRQRLIVRRLFDKPGNPLAELRRYRSREIFLILDGVVQQCGNDQIRIALRLPRRRVPRLRAGGSRRAPRSRPYAVGQRASVPQRRRPSEQSVLSWSLLFNCFKMKKGGIYPPSIVMLVRLRRCRGFRHGSILLLFH